MLGSARGTRPRPRPRLRLCPTHRSAASVLTCAFAALGRATLVYAQPALPYIPTSILLPSDSEGNSSPVAYIFAPSADSPGAVDFLALDVSSTLRASSLQPTRLASALPFTGNGTTFAPSLLPNGTIAVVVGDCAPGSASSLWTTMPDPATTTTSSSTTTKKEPEWTSHSIAPFSGWDYAQSGPYHLGGILSFSAQLSPVLSPPTLYLYGGMCPLPNPSSSSPSLSSGEEENNWQSDARYSNRMLRLTSSSSSWDLSYAPGAQPVVAAAGFTLTALPPSLTNLSTTSTTSNSEKGGSSSGSSRIVTQQTSHVMLGGHTTAHAFVNMSTAAIWSLPEETWSFVTISSPLSSSGGTKTDLARRRQAGAGSGSEADVVVVDSRSGHTAVLSADGTRLVVYGGWVGDVDTPAVPQLAVLRLGVPGLSEWAWEIPSDTPQDGEEDGIGGGVYGHGAALLPGNVMMVYGGYEIVPEGGKGGVVKRRRAGGGRVFYNITSGRWSEEYVSPLTHLGSSGNGGGSTSDAGGGSTSSSSPGPSDNGDAPSSADDSSRKRQISLGVGLGVGGLILLLLAALGARWFRRRQKRRAARDETLRSLAQGVGVNGSLPRGLGEDDDEMLEREYAGTGLFPWTAAAAREWYTGGGGPYTQGRRSLGGYESLRRPGPSLQYYIPPPPSPSSASSGRLKGARGLHQPTYDFAPLGRARNGIEPIYEADEDEDGDLAKEGCPLSPDGNEEHDDGDDPFVTPTTLSSPRHSNSPTPPPSRGHAHAHGQGQGSQQQDPDVQGWVSDVDAPTTTSSSTSTGRLSPLRRALSIKSTRSAKSPSAGAQRATITTVVGSAFSSSPTTSSQPSLSDDGSHRTGSNLSERSRPGTGGPWAEDRVLLSRLHSTLSTTVAAGENTIITTIGGSGNSNKVGGRTRSDSATSTSASGKSYSTAKSHLNFAVLREEGPGLLMGTTTAASSGSTTTCTKEGDGRMGEDEEGEEEEDQWLHVHDYNEPGSPSKTKPHHHHQQQKLRRSWLRSLKRVFSGGTPTPTTTEAGSSSGSGSPTREALLWSSSDYYDELFGTTTTTGGGSGGGGLQRRRQQQQQQQDELDDWDRDIERAAAHRTVQIMFTVPKEPLRVVNAEIEREEESVLIVDPADEDKGHDSDSDNGRAAPAVDQHHHQEEQQQQHVRVPLPLPITQNDDDDNNNNNNANRHKDRGDRLSSTTLELPTGVSTSTSPSPSPSLRARAPSPSAISLTTATLHTAEAVRLERPPSKTRVLEMVESIESQSQSQPQ
ncbi:uncharacterized protein B0T15DRAFT_395498 [Chaetomium strumarium]|uniref:Galactose oxidase n=1 Tax=Chaetomium strumarium TaxID=1170767 RepID=A0AAJ0M3A1_9PEZI|nr:hypothetical protein B0T15DRAFT_395498 [Chaetomium strumarium]